MPYMTLTDSFYVI